MSAVTTAPDERLTLLETVITGWRVLDLAGKQPALVRPYPGYATDSSFLCVQVATSPHFCLLAFTGSSIFRDD